MNRDGILVFPSFIKCFFFLFQVLYLLLTSDKVYEKSKFPLRLTEIGHLGLVEMMKNCDISGPMFKRFLEQVSVQGRKDEYRSELI